MMRPRLRPLGVGEVIDAGTEIYRRHFRTLVAQVAVVVVPIQVLSFLVTLSATPGTADLGTPFDPDDPFRAAEFWTLVAGTLVVSLLTVVAAIVGAGLCARTCVDAYLGTPVEPRATFRFAARRAGALVSSSVLVFAILLVTGVLCFLVGAWLLVLFAVVPVALVVEGIGPAAALRRSASLVRGRWWGTLGILAVAFVVVGLARVAITLPAELLVDVADGTVTAFAVQGLFGLAADLLTTPLVAATLVVAYVDLRVRREGFDVALLAAAAGGEPAAADAPSTAAGPPEQPRAW